MAKEFKVDEAAEQRMKVAIEKTVEIFRAHSLRTALFTGEAIAIVATKLFDHTKDGTERAEG